MSQRQSPTSGGAPAFLEDHKTRPGLREFVLTIRGESVAIRVEITSSEIEDALADEFLDAGEAVLARRLLALPSRTRLEIVP